MTVVMLSYGCGILSRSPRRGLRIEADPETTLKATVDLVVVVENTAGQQVQATGEGVSGSTVRALCESLTASLKQRGCEGSYGDGDPDETNRLARAMHQVVVLPEGWGFVSADARTTNGASSGALTVSIERP